MGLLRAIRVVQSCLGGRCHMAHRLAGTARSRAGGGAAAAALAAIYPPLVWTPAYTFSETLFSVLALGCAGLLTLDSGGRAWSIAAGALAGLACSRAR